MNVERKSIVCDPTETCECAKDKCPRIKNYAPRSLAMAYVDMQEWQDVLDPDKALEVGTIFGELVLPFYGARAACDRSCPYKNPCENMTPEYRMPRSNAPRNSGNYGRRYRG